MLDCLRVRFGFVAGFALLCAGCAPQNAEPPANASPILERSPSVSEVPQLFEHDIESIPPVVPRFVDVARSQGIDFQRDSDIVPDRFFLPEIMGGGAAWLDYDQDGLLDLYASDGCGLLTNKTKNARGNRLFRNLDHGRFQDVSSSTNSDDRGYGHGCTVGDFDADGFPDLYVTNYGRNVLFHNQGDGTFEEAAQHAGVDDASWGTSAVWLDLDGDRDLDLYVVNYLDVPPEKYRVCEFNGNKAYCGPGDYEAQTDRVYLNQNDGRFVESAGELGFAIPDGKGLAVIAADFDQDRRPEIYVANDMAANFLFTRTGTQTAAYRNVAVEAGCAVSRDGKNEASMGVACQDFDGDGWIDLFLTHYFQAKNTFYRNRGQLLFEDESRRSRIAATSYEFLGFGTAAFDYDFDGASDLFVANGHVLGPRQEPFEMPAQLLRNDGAGHFDDISSLAGPYFQERCVGRGMAAADYDNDGDWDLAVTHIDRPLALLQNQTERRGRHFIGLQLVTATRTPPIGGRVIVREAGQERRFPITSGGSYLSASDSRLLAGVTDAGGPVDVRVEWPSGHSDIYTGLPSDCYWLIVEDTNHAPLNLPGPRFAP